MKPRSRSRRFAIHALCLLALLPVVNAATAHPASAADRCAAIEIEYFPTHVRPNELMEMSLLVANCASTRVTLGIRVRADGPCRFAYPPEHRQQLEAHHSVGLHVLFFAPSCEGRFTVQVAALNHQRVLAGDRAWFVAERRG